MSLSKPFGLSTVKGQAVTLVCLFTQFPFFFLLFFRQSDEGKSRKILSLLIEGANRRGEDVRQHRSPEGYLR